MAITKILAKNNRLDVLIRYVTNQDKTEEQVLTAYLNCDPLRPERSRLSWPLSWPRRSPMSIWPGIKC